ncbi:MAG: SDR family oxidoreductase [Anaerolineae bacterium]
MFTGKTVLVTGGSRGIGRAIAQAFAAEGARVAINYRSSHAAAEETLAQLPGGGHILAPADVTDPAAVEALINDVAARFGHLDILINNAAIYEEHPLTEVSYERWQAAWQAHLQANLISVANLIYCAAHHMIPRGGGRIVNVSSRGAFRGEPHAPAYGASKAGLNALGGSLAQLLAPHGVFIHTVAPGFVETDMAAELLNGPAGEGIRRQSPLGRVAQPDEVAHVVLFLASEKAAFATGAIVDMNGASYLRM